MCHQSSTDDHLLNKSSGYFRVKRSKISWHLTSNLLSESKQKQNKLCIATRSVHFWDEEINQPRTSISLCILLATHVCQLMKSAHGSPVIDSREVLICRLRTGSSLSLLFFLHLSSLLALLHQHPHSYTFLIMRSSIMPGALYWVLAAGLGGHRGSCRAKC